MNLEEFTKEVKAYFEGAKIEALSNISEVEGIKYAEVEASVLLNAFNNLPIRIHALAYQNGTSQITFKLGKAKNDSKLKDAIADFNLRCFGLKAVVEGGDLRLYNQSFFKDVDGYMYSFNMAMSLFLNPGTSVYIKPLINFIA